MTAEESNRPLSERRNFFLYIDEAHLIATQAMVEFFPEARKFHLGITLAHQYLDPLPAAPCHAILGNVGTLVVFRLGACGAEVLAQEFAPEVSPTDLVSVPNRQAYLKLLVDGTTTRPLSATMLPPPVFHGSPRGETIAASRQRYCRPVAEVEQALWRPWQGPPSGHQQRLDL